MVSLFYAEQLILQNFSPLLLAVPKALAQQSQVALAQEEAETQ